MHADSSYDDVQQAFESLAPKAPEPEAAPVEPAPEPTEKPEAKAEPAAKDTKDTAEGRDEKGRFAPKKPEVKAAGQAKAGGAPTVPPGEVAPPAAPLEQKPAAEAPKPPQSLTPAEREDWAKAPASLQAAFHRREREFTTKIQEAAEARKGYQAFRDTVAPYEGMIRAEGADPVRAVGSLLQTAAALRSQMPQQVASVLGQAIKTFGVERFGPQFVEMLAQQIDGAPSQHSQPAPQPQPDVRQLVQQELSKFQQQALGRSVQTDLQRFQATQPEFLDDVREDMADVMQSAARRGVALSLEDAYARAIKLHPEIAPIVEQREAAKRAANANASTQRAEAAASSVKSKPAIGVAKDAGNEDTESSVRASIARLRGR